MIIITTTNAEIIVNEAEILDLRFELDQQKVVVNFKDGSSGSRGNVINVKTYPGTPEMTLGEVIEHEPEPKPKDYEDDSILVLYNELKRIEKEEKKKKKEQYPGLKYIQRKGNATRAIVVARQHDINTIGDLLKVGRVTFQGFRNAGPKCGALITQGLSNLYDIEKW